LNLGPFPSFGFRNPPNASVAVNVQMKERKAPPLSLSKDGIPPR
jgi:hypothetical protein